MFTLHKVQACLCISIAMRTRKPAPAKMQPALHMSTAVPYLLSPRSSSGARYQRVTT